MTARGLWDEIANGGWPQLSQWRVDAKSEGLHLDFKQAGFSGSDVRSDDRKNLAKGISGFANTEGGLLVYGAATRAGGGKQDVLDALVGVSPLDAYTERLRIHVRDSTTPPVSGIDVRPFEDPQRPNTGVAVVYIPLTDAGPFRAEGPPEVAGRYFMRTTSDTIVMPHQVLAAMFGRRPSPQLRAGIQLWEGRKLVLHVENVGRGAAVSAFVRIKFDGKPDPGMIYARGSWREKTFDVVAGGWSLAFGLGPGDLLYPGESRVAGSFDLGGTDHTFTVRIDCENALPVEATQTISLPGDRTIVWL